MKIVLIEVCNKIRTVKYHMTFFAKALAFKYS